MGKVTITNDRQVAGLKPADKVYWATVKGCAGLRVQVRVGRDGLPRRTFFYRSRQPDGKRQQQLIKVGDFMAGIFGLHEAREEWARLRGIKQTHGRVREYIEQERAANVAAIEAATQQSENDAYTVAKLAEEYITFQATQVKSWAETERCLKVYALPHIGARPAHSVQKKDVIEIRDRLVQAGKAVQGNRALAALRGAFNYGLDRARGGITANPCARVKRLEEQERKRYLGDVELRRVLQNIAALPQPFGDLVELLLLTGSRIAEAVEAPISEFDLATDGPVWTLPSARVKNKHEHKVPLSRQAVEVVKRRIAAAGTSKFLFPHDPAVRSEREDRAMRTDAVYPKLNLAMPKFGTLPWRPHDLRRTCASGLSALGIPEETIAHILNHVKKSITAKVYIARSHDKEMRAALQQWADHLDGLRVANVVPITGKKPRRKTPSPSSQP